MANLSSLDAFDKINLASCAVKRAQGLIDPYAFGAKDNAAQFEGEWQTMQTWRDHRCMNFSHDGKVGAYVDY